MTKGQVWLGLVAVFLGVFFPINADAKGDFVEYINGLKQEAIAQGLDTVAVNHAFANVVFLPRAVKADRNQPEFKLTLDTYLPRALPEWKLARGVELFNQHRELLTKIATEYGVQARFIVALWGVESNFGRLQGKLHLISALTTLAYEGRREAFFKKQLFAAIAMTEQGHIDAERLVGSWAGATGQTQFIPTSFMAYAQDYDGDGVKDIWNTPADVFASIANYLKSEGWNGDETWGRRVTLPKGFDVAQAGREKAKRKLLTNWQALGVRRFGGKALPSNPMQASVILPDDVQGRAYLTYGNFNTLMRWNRSTYFGVTVGTFADRLGWRMRLNGQ